MKIWLCWSALLAKARCAFDQFGPRFWAQKRAALLASLDRAFGKSALRFWPVWTALLAQKRAALLRAALLKKTLITFEPVDRFSISAYVVKAEDMARLLSFEDVKLGLMVVLLRTKIVRIK